MERISLNQKLRVVVLCCLSLAAASGSTETCKNSESSACMEVKTERRVIADYAPDLPLDDEEEEGSDQEADLTMHMQMRLNVDIPIDTQEAPSGNHKLSLTGAAATRSHVAQKPPASAPSDSAVAGLQRPATVAELLAAQKSADAAASFLTGNQLLLGAFGGALLVVLGALLATGLRTYLTGRKGRSEDELKAAGKAWMLDWALGFEPDDVEDVLPIQAELKMRPKKKDPPVAAPDGGHSTDEEEPEAESDGGELLEDAVYVAEQVEEANQAADAGYGIQLQGRHVDQIRGVDLR